MTLSRSAVHFAREPKGIITYSLTGSDFGIGRARVSLLSGGHSLITMISDPNPALWNCRIGRNERKGTAARVAVL